MFVYLHAHVGKSVTNDYLGFSTGPIIIIVSSTNFLNHIYILSVNEKLPVFKFRYFGKYIIQLDGYFYAQVSGERQTGLEKRTSSESE